MWLPRKRAARRSQMVEAEVSYLRHADVPPRLDPSNPERSVLSLAQHGVRFHDLRNSVDPPSLHREGFMMLPHRTSVTDFGDPGQNTIYCRELEELIRDVTGAPLVFLSPTVVLRSKSHPHYVDGVIGDRVADVVHSDRTDRSVWIEAGVALEHYGAKAPQGRLVSYNLWRALTPPPQDFPLALCDLRTVREERLVRSISIGNPASRGQDSEFYLSLFDPEHRWCYFPDLTRDEVLVFQQYDTAATGPSGCLHTAFRDPSCTKAVATRLSVEARAYAFFPS